MTTTDWRNIIDDAWRTPALRLKFEQTLGPRAVAYDAKDDLRKPRFIGEYHRRFNVWAAKHLDIEIPIELREQEFLDRVYLNSTRGQNWVCALSPEERVMCLDMVERKILDTDDGHIFWRYDPDWHAFIGMLEDEFLRRQDTTRKTAKPIHIEYAERTTRFLLGYALSDGQGGWNLTFNKDPKVWDAAFAGELVSRYVESQRYDDQ